MTLRKIDFTVGELFSCTRLTENHNIMFITK